MNENAGKLVEALRSGEYSQTQKRLRDEKGFCCLGVACDLYAKETNKGEWVSDDKRVYLFDAGSKASLLRLPYPVQKWFGFSSIFGAYKGKSKTLANHNDDGSTFSEIADIIESEPRGLFNE